MIGDGYLLHLNSENAQGFEFCHIEDNQFSILPIQEVHSLVYDQISNKGKEILKRKLQQYFWALKKLKAQSQDDNSESSYAHTFINQNQNQKNNFLDLQESDLINNSSKINCEILEKDKTFYEKIIEKEDREDSSITFCFLYSGQSQDEVNERIIQYKKYHKQFKINNIVVLVNGKNSLHPTLQQYNDRRKIPNQIKHNVCSAYEYVFNDGDNMRCKFFIINEKQSQIKLLRWIYTGVFRHFCSKFCYVGDLDENIQESFFSEAFNVLEQKCDSDIQEYKYFGASGYCNLQRIRKFNDSNQKSCKESDSESDQESESDQNQQNNQQTIFQQSNLQSQQKCVWQPEFMAKEQSNQSIFDNFLTNCFIAYNNYLNYQIQIDSLSQIKKYHNPFLCLYRFNLIYLIIDNYLCKLEKNCQNGKVDLCLNLVLPKMMYSSTQNKQLHLFASAIGDKEIKLKDQTFYKQFEDLSNKQKSLMGCNKKAAQSDAFFYKFIYIQREIEFNFKLAIVLFVYIFSPFQFVWQITENYITRICTTIFFPFMILMLLFLYIILSQQYLITDTITKSSRKLMAVFYKVEAGQEQLLIRFNNQPKFYKGKFKIINQNKEIRIKISCQDKKYYIQATTQNQEFLRNQIYNSYCDIIKQFKIAIYFRKVFKCSCFCSFFCSAIVIINIIYSICSRFYMEDQQIVILQILVAIIILVLFVVFRTQNLYLIVGMTFNMIVCVMFSELYHMLYYPKKYKQYYYSFNRLGEYLAFTIVFLFIFLLVENQTGYQGYVFLGILYYNLIILIVDTITIILTIVLAKCQLNNSKVERNYKNSNLQNLSQVELCDQRNENENQNQNQNQNFSEGDQEITFSVQEQILILRKNYNFSRV